MLAVWFALMFIPAFASSTAIVHAAGVPDRGKRTDGGGIDGPVDPEPACLEDCDLVPEGDSSGVCDDGDPCTLDWCEDHCCVHDDACASVGECMDCCAAPGADGELYCAMPDKVFPCEISLLDQGNGEVEVAICNGSSQCPQTYMYSPATIDGAVVLQGPEAGQVSLGPGECRALVSVVLQPACEEKTASVRMTAGSPPSICGGSGGCRKTLVVSVPPMDCDDENACTVDSCSNGICVYDPIVCDDEDPCTLDECDVESGCAFPPDPEPVDKCACWWFEFTDPQIAVTPPSWTIASLEPGLNAAAESMHRIREAAERLRDNAADIERHWQFLFETHGWEIPPDEMEAMRSRIESAIKDFETVLDAETARLTQMEFHVIPGAYTPLQGDYHVGLAGLPKIAEIPLWMRLEMVEWNSTDSFSPHGGIWSAWGPASATVGYATVTVNFNGNYGRARIVANWDECAVSAAQIVEAKSDQYEGAVQKEGILAYDNGKNAIADVEAQWALIDSLVGQAADALGVIPGGAVFGYALGQLWGRTFEIISQKISEMKVANCGQLHENYGIAEMLPEREPPGGYEATDLPVKAYEICSPGSGERSLPLLGHGEEP